MIDAITWRCSRPRDYGVSVAYELRLPSGRRVDIFIWLCDDEGFGYASDCVSRRVVMPFFLRPDDGAAMEASAVSYASRLKALGRHSLWMPESDVVH